MLGTWYSTNTINLKEKVSSINVSVDDLHTAIKEEVLKREVCEGDKATAALKKYKSMLSKEAKKKSEN